MLCHSRPIGDFSALVLSKLKDCVWSIRLLALKHKSASFPICYREKKRKKLDDKGTKGRGFRYMLRLLSKIGQCKENIPYQS